MVTLTFVRKPRPPLLCIYLTHRGQRRWPRFWYPVFLSGGGPPVWQQCHLVDTWHHCSGAQDPSVLFLKLFRKFDSSTVEASRFSFWGVSKSPRYP